MPRYLLIPILFLVVFWSSCRKDFEFQDSSGNLTFSRDTVYLDTVFTNIGSSTYTLKVYNRSNDDINVPSIRLGEGQSSSYRLNVDGMAGKEFENIPILAKDSIFIFIETTFDITPTNENSFLYTDAILFDMDANEQQVPLVTLVQDAIFLFPSELADGTRESLLLGLDTEGNEIRIDGFILDDDQLNFSNEKPYVIYGYAGVAEGKTLTIEAGARIHFHKDSGLLIGSGGNIAVNGALSTDEELLENEVIFEGDRLEPEFAEVAGQWGTIWMVPGSTGSMEYITIKNATVGLLVDGDENSVTANLTLKNSQIHNSASVNFWGRTAWLEAENVVIGSAGNIALYCNLGGNYSFTHSTIANYWRSSFRNGVALQIDNFVMPNENEIIARDLIQANFVNTIIDGNNSIELLLRRTEDRSFNYSFSNCLIQFRDTNEQFIDDPLFDFENNPAYNAVLLNGNTDFIDTRTNNFNIGQMSDAIGIGSPNAALLVPLDIRGFQRPATPDIGAYQFLPEN